MYRNQLTFITPKTNNCVRVEHEAIQKDTPESLKQITGDKKVIQVGNFNCKEVKGKTFEDEDNWGNRLLRLIMNNSFLRWALENRRNRRDY